MSGTLPQYRPGNKPLIVDGVPVLKFDKYGQPVWKYWARPGGTYVNGRCVDWVTGRYVATRHVLDHTPAPHRPSKHARARIKPRTAKQQRRVRNMQARLTQLSKTHTLDVQATIAGIMEAS